MSKLKELKDHYNIISFYRLSLII